MYPTPLSAIAAVNHRDKELCGQVVYTASTYSRARARACYTPSP